MSYLKTFFRLLLGLFMTYAGLWRLHLVLVCYCCGRKRQLLVHCWHSFMSPSSLAISTSTSITLMPLVSTPTICVLSVCSFSQSLFSSLFGAQEAGSS